MRKELYWCHDNRRKLSSNVEDPSQLAPVPEKTVFVRKNERRKRLSRDNVDKTLSTAELLKKEELQNEDEENQTESVVEDLLPNENKMAKVK